MNSTVPEQPLGILDLTGVAFRYWRQNIGQILRYLLVPSIIVGIAGVAFQWVASYGTTMVTQSKSIAAGLGLVGGFILVFIVWTLSWWWLGLRLFSIVRLALGFSANLEDAQKYMYRRKWAVAGLSSLLVGMVMVMTIISTVFMVIGMVVPGPARVIAMGVTVSIGMLLLVVSGIAYGTLGHLALCVLACEDKSATTVLGKTLKMYGKHFWRCVGFGLSFFLVFCVVNCPFNLPIAVVTLTDYLQHGVFTGAAAQYNPSLGLMILTQAWESAVGMLVRPLTALAWGYCYYDLRMRSEGLDLKRKLDQLSTRAA